MSDGRVLSGQQRLDQFGVAVPFTEQSKDYQSGNDLGVTGDEGNVNAEIVPTDRNAAKVRIFDEATAQASLLAITTRSWSVYRSIPNSDLASVMTGLALVFNKSEGTGSTAFPAANQTVIVLGSGTIQINPRANSQASASIVGELVPDITDYEARNAELRVYQFFLPITSLTLAAVRGKASAAGTGTTVTITIASPGVVTQNTHGKNNGDEVVFTTTGALPTGLSPLTPYFVVNKATNTYQLSLTSGGSAINTSGSQSGVHTSYVGIHAWPKFRPQGHTFVLKGQQVSMSANASTTARISASSDNISAERVYGGGISDERGVTTRPVDVRPTIHGVLTISPSSDSADVTVTANADSIEIDYSSIDALAVVEAVNNTFTDSGTAAASILPTSLAATPGATSVPTSGVYLYQLEVNPDFGFGVALVTAFTFDFSYFAP